VIGSLGVILDTADTNPEIVNEPGFASDVEDLFGELGTLVGTECSSPELAGSAMSEVLVYLVSQKPTRSSNAVAFIDGAVETLCAELEGVIELTFEGRAACLAS
jgi:hypothetical protein